MEIIFKYSSKCNVIYEDGSNIKVYITPEHPPHSPDLSPCDYSLNEELGGQVFKNDAAVETFGDNEIKNVTTRKNVL